ncbi:MAG: hypothetical protein EAZ74_03565 [Alphaproteobacteria bacterium]|nr:MAG: hypothetical protein EAY76_01670 [Alphaproteobacteria bacterium]TAF14623.1 MAG: hypothetical protein EAZ74_03565 [Alphaproteobacteria bacterium]TAF41710.1 MAG: hypothetical protein EAZ66_00840 [Alphaproteobacteria bacterium]TAF75651.1 MAG: hypothetical protein EAZ52_06225 [Alphaproteobacteria bacterium]
MCFRLRLQRYVVKNDKETFICLTGEKADIAIFAHIGSAHGIAIAQKDDGSLDTICISGYYNGTSDMFVLCTNKQNSVHIKKGIFQRIHEFVKKLF